MSCRFLEGLRKIRNDPAMVYAILRYSYSIPFAINIFCLTELVDIIADLVCRVVIFRIIVSSRSFEFYQENSL